MINTVEEFDNVFDEEDVKTISKKIDEAEWKFGQSGIYNTHRVFWFHQLLQDPFFSTNLFDKVQFKIGAQCKLRRVFANGQTYGQDGDWHTDSLEENQYTFVYYANKEWKPYWGGETSFQIDNKIVSVPFKYNKGIFFPSNMSHCGKAPSRECFKLRVTIAFHFKIINWLR